MNNGSTCWTSFHTKKPPWQEGGWESEAGSLLPLQLFGLGEFGVDHVVGTTAAASG
jgi:hypothetical protein